MNYSCVQGWTGGLGGTGNFGKNPLFIDPDGPDGVSGNGDDNLRLTRDSPCIDAGSNPALPLDSADLDGDGERQEPIPYDLDANPRIVDGDKDGTATVDLGAQEYQGAPPIPTVTAWGVLVVALSLVMAGTLILRRTPCAPRA
jgi:hypothetical protein